MEKPVTMPWTPGGSPTRTASPLAHLGEIGQGHRVHRPEMIPHTPAVAQRHPAQAGLQLYDAGADRAGVRSQPAHEQTE